MRALAATLTITAFTALAACSSDPHLMNLSSGHDGPDEFSVLPTKPLQMPSDLNTLPAPTPGGSNITDPTPKADAVAALGGRPAALEDRGIAANDAAIVAYAGRNGAQPGIRSQLAAEDEAWRSRHSRRLLEVLARTNVYYRAYEPFTLDSWAEMERWRRAGARTPAAPPK